MAESFGFDTFDAWLLIERYARACARIRPISGDLPNASKGSLKPPTHVDNAGLVWLLNGNRLVALTELSARMETKSGATLTHYRKPGGLGRALAWELDTMSQRPILTRNTENK
jgi:hypothetical protein